MKFEVESGGSRYEIEAPDEAAAMQAIQGLVQTVKPSPAMGMLGGAGQAAVGAADIGRPSVGQDIAQSAGSRGVAGVLDVPGIPGDLGSLASDAGSWAARGILGLMGKSPEEQDLARRKADVLTKSSVALPGSEDIKQAVGFEAYQPKTGAGEVFDKTIGAGIELAPGVLAGGGAKTVGKAVGDVAKFAMAPAVAGEAAGQATKGTALEPWARGGAMLAAGGIAGAGKGKITGAKSVDDWRAIGKQAYGDMKSAGIGVKPMAFDRALNSIEQELHVAGFRPALHQPVATVLKEMKAVRGVPQSYEELDQLHRLAMGQTKNIDADTRRVAGMLAEKIDDFMMNLKQSDLIAGRDPNVAFKALSKGRDAWRKMRTGERIENLMEKARDRVGANYTSAGMQTALRQEFKNFKWKGKEVSREFKMLAKEEQAVVNSIIRGVSVENALRLVGKFNIRNPFAVSIMTALGLTGNAVLGGGMLAAGEAARRVSARGTIAKAERLGEMVRGGKVTPRSRRLPPNAVLYGLAARRTTDEPEQGR